MSKEKDIEFIAQLRQDVKGSYAVLYRDYYGMVKHMVINNSGTVEDSSDIFQDTVIALFEMINRKDFRLKSALSTLIYSIARNRWLNKIRELEAIKKFKDFEKHIAIEDEYNPEIDEKVIRMQHAVEAMGDPCKSILISFYFLRKKMQEIADDLNYESHNHAKSQKYKCLQRLKKMMV